MKKWISFLLAVQLFAVSAYAKGRIQNEDVKSLSDITAAVLTTTGNLTSSNACIASPGSTSGLATGLFIYDTTNSSFVPSGTTVAGLPGTCSAGQIQMSANATNSSTGDALTFGGQSSQLINDTKIWLTGVTPNQQLSTALAAGAIGGSGGSKNYLTTYIASTSSSTANTGNGNFEQGSTSGWSLGTVGTLTNGLPTGSPTFGSGASGNLSISTVTAGSQIAGNYSLSYASSAATTQGNMLASSAFFIDSEDQAKVMTVKFYYTANSGAANDNWSGTSSNSFAWAAYDVTNSAWLSGAGNFCMTQSSGKGYCTGTFQTGSTTSQIRFVMYNANASAGATTLYFDDFFVGPQTAPYGTVMTDWVAYTPTITGFGTVTGVAGFTRRVGDSLQGRVNFGTGTGTAVLAAISIGYNGANNNVTIDPAKIGNTIVVGSGAVSLNSTTFFGVSVLATGGNQTINMGVQSSTIQPLVNQNGNTVVGSSGNFVEITFMVPIVGWGSTSVQSSDTDTRVISAGANLITTNETIPGTATDTIITFNNSRFDTAGAFDIVTNKGRFTAPVTGYYSLQSNLSVTLGGTVTSNFAAYFIVNGATSAQLGRNSQTAFTAGAVYSFPIQGIVKLNAGDFVEVHAQSATQAVTVTAATSSDSSFFYIQRISGPAVITATESVNGKYYSSSTSLSGSLATVVYATKGWDTHAAYNSSTGIWTCPVSGKYQFNANLATAGTIALNNQVDIQLQQSGSSSLISESLVYAGGAETSIPVAVSDQVNCLAGDTVKVQVSSGATGPSIVSSNSKNYISWSRVGN